jgi:hypothetical protein
MGSAVLAVAIVREETGGDGDFAGADGQLALEGKAERERQAVGVAFGVFVFDDGAGLERGEGPGEGALFVVAAFDDGGVKDGFGGDGEAVAVREDGGGAEAEEGLAASGGVGHGDDTVPGDIGRRVELQADGVGELAGELDLGSPEEDLGQGKEEEHGSSRKPAAAGWD